MQTTSFYYYNAKFILKVTLVFNKFQKAKIKNINFVHLSVSLFLATHNPNSIQMSEFKHTKQLPS